MASTPRLIAAAAVIAMTTVLTTPGTAPQAAPSLPIARLAIDDLEYLGAFRLTSADIGASNTNYATGTLGFNARNNSLFVAGFSRDNAVAEFAIPERLGTGTEVSDLPLVSTALQPFEEFLDEGATGNPDRINRINGLYVHDDRLIVNAERWYDAAGRAKDTSLSLDVDDLSGAVDGFFELDGAARAGGYMSPVPTEWQAALGGPVVTGWASNTSIISRHSVGPTLFTFDPDDLENRDPLTSPRIDTTRHMDFAHRSGNYLDPNALVSGSSASPLWNWLSKARYAFIAPGTATFVVIGSTGGIESGIGYKITQDTGRLCGGHCPYEAGDVTNAYWLFDLNEIVAADDVHLPRPYAYGPWSVPFDDGGQHAVIGGAFDPTSSTLYVSLSAAGQVRTYDRPPLIVAFSVPTPARATINGPARALVGADRLATE